MGVVQGRAGTAAVLLIGNELLSGKVAEQNLFPLAKTLRALGIAITRVSMLGDDLEVLANEVNALRRSHDVVFTSGGVGPTHDDVTIEAVARALGVPVEENAHLRSMLFQVYGTDCSAAHLRMARIPRGSTLVSSPGVRWPTVVVDNIWLMPGIPELFRMKLSVVREHLRGQRRIAERTVFLQLDEVALKPYLDGVVSAYPEVDVGSYPKWFDESYKTQVTFDGVSEQAVEEACRHFEASLPDTKIARREQ